MPGFEFRYRRGGGEPTIRTLVLRTTGRLTKGDLLVLFEDAVGLAAAGDTTLLGVAVETVDGRAGEASIRVITDADAVYAVDDPHRRAKGDHLDVVGDTGTQGVAAISGSDLVVEVDSDESEPTLVSILERAHHRPAQRAARPVSAGGDLNAALARLVTRHYRESTGRGPTKTRAFYRDEVIVMILEDTMTKAERSLVSHGRADAVRHMREAFRDAIRQEIVAGVEALTGAKVRAFLGAHHLEPDILVETFVLDRPVRGEPGEPPDAA